jgi:HAD superfamily hydrolase (TIGR01490 family)
MAIYCEQWFEMHGKELLDNKMVREIKFHQEQGAKVVIVSGSFEQCVSPIAAHLNVDRYICSQLETKNERFTGKLLNGPVIGEGKAKAIRQHLSDEANVDLNMSFAYGDDVSDIPMLSLVKNPVVIGKNEALIQYANENNWSLFC